MSFTWSMPSGSINSRYFPNELDDVQFHKSPIPTNLLEMEFLLFECLQDLTGGDLVFLLGVNSLLVDTTTTDERTTR